VENERTSHDSIVLAICLPKNYQIWRTFDEVLTKTSWEIFLAHPVHVQPARMPVIRRTM